MKHLKNFKLFEAVIMPPKSENNLAIRSYEDAVEYSQQDFDVVQYDEFFDSLSEVDKRHAPPKHGTPFFALFHPERKRAMFVVCDTNVFRFMPMKEIIDDIIGHEMIHAEQSRRKDIDYSLPNPTDRKAYFSNKEEIMAFSFTIANEIKKTSRSFEDAKTNFKNNRIGGQGGSIWGNIKRVCDEDVIKRYRKYIYMYLEKMFDGEEVKPSVSPFKELDNKSKLLSSDSEGKPSTQKRLKDNPYWHSKKDFSGKYESPDDLEKIGFNKMPQEDRLNIIMDIIDNSDSPSKFMSYFSPEDIRAIKDRTNFNKYR
jgi:hypothetical protein